MAQLKYCDKHNQVGFLRKPNESAGFAEIVDFLRGSNLRYALTANPTFYDSIVQQFWQSAIAHTRADGSLEIIATIDTIRYTISEASIRDSLQLDDATGITMLPNVDLFEGQEHAAQGQSQPSPTPPPIPTSTSPPPPIPSPTPPSIPTSPPPPIPSPTPPPIPTPTSPPPPPPETEPPLDIHL
ncbi:hypothetical protein Tco_0428289 [Tanacetum coccineum]